jgi:hypothetical protein
MAQIIKHRRGSITQLKDVTARVGEILLATGSIGTLNGPFTFIGETEGVAGAYRPLSKIYQGTTPPSITVGAYGSTMDGTPFYGQDDKTLFILNKDGNVNPDLTGNIEGNVINSVTITNLTGETITATQNVNISGSLTVTGNTTLNSDLYVSGNLYLLGSATELIISSSTVVIDDNIITLNAFSPFERYGGIEVIDSGSNNTGSFLWDSQNDYWLFVSSSGQSSKAITTTPGNFGSETSLTTHTIPKATSHNSIGDSLLIDNGTFLTYNTNKFIIDSSNGDTTISGNVTLSATGSVDNGTKTSAVIFRNSSNVLGYVPLTETTNVLDGILGYRNVDGQLVFSTLIDGGTY